MVAALTSVGTNSNNEWKLTIKDADRNSFDITTCEGSYDSENGVVRIRYDVAKVESNSFISAIILGSDDSIKYYGRVAEVSGEALGHDYQDVDDTASAATCTKSG